MVHPFCSGTGGDVRITTRTDESDPFNCLYSAIHEIGHGLYAQAAPDPLLPAADYCSMGVHESQSRFWENQICRSRPFADWLLPAMTEAFGALDLDGPDQLHAAINRVHPGYIRTEADEVHYNLHILLRFELERELIGGTLQVEDLEQAWNDRFARDFGLAVSDPSQGVLQDVHWAAGLFGYFPTYSLGNIYAACLDEAMRTALPDRDELVRGGGNTAHPRLAACEYPCSRTGAAGTAADRTGDRQEAGHRAADRVPGNEIRSALPSLISRTDRDHAYARNHVPCGASIANFPRSLQEISSISSEIDQARNRRRAYRLTIE